MKQVLDSDVGDLCSSYELFKNCNT